MTLFTAPSQHPGMGAVPRGGGAGPRCSFRVWAPHARQVAVAGSFNGWATDDVRLAPEGGGYWSADVPGVWGGAQYKYAITTPAGELVLRNDPYARQVTSSAGNSVVFVDDFDWGPGGFAMPPWNELVVYELHAGTFHDWQGGGPGGFDTVVPKLPYLRDLGVNAIEVMPAMEFATDFSRGYNPAHLFAIESAYGGPQSLQRLVRAAHEHGIAVLFDLVYNHLGPSDLDLWHFDGPGEHGFGGAYFYNDWRAETPWGATRPDYGRPEVRQFLRDNALYWLETYRMDGLRWDMTAYIRNVHGRGDDPASDLPDGWGLMQRINGEIDARQPWKLSIAEDMRGDAWITRDPGRGGAGFDAQWDATFVHALRDAVVPPSDGGRNMYAVRDAVARRYDGDPFRRVIYTESHDEAANGRARVPEEVWPGNAASWASKKRSTLAAAVALTAPGIPMLFQGQEFLEDGYFQDGDPIDWAKAARHGGIVELYRALVRLRRNWHDTTRGLRGPHVNVFHVNDADKVIAYHRWDRGGPRDDVVVVANFGNRTYPGYAIGVPRGGWWRTRFNGDWSGFDPAFSDAPSFDAFAEGGGRDGLTHHAAVGVGPYSAVILSQDA